MTHKYSPRRFAQVGLFRKSGVKSRIQALREMNQSTPGAVDYTGQSPYDVADMLKQYFRDLPEPLLTSKLSETLLLIFQSKNLNFSNFILPASLTTPSIQQYYVNSAFAILSLSHDVHCFNLTLSFRQNSVRVCASSFVSPSSSQFLSPIFGKVVNSFRLLLNIMNDLVR